MLRKKNLFLILNILCLLLLVTSGSWAQSLSGNLDGQYGPATFTLDGDCYIAEDAFVSFAAGTRIEATGYYFIEVRGSVNVDGSETERVVFTTSADNEAGWAGFRFYQCQNNASFDYTVFENALNSNLNEGFGGAFYLNRSDATFSNCAFNYNEAAFGGALYVYNAEASFDGCTFTRNHATNIGGAIYSSTVDPLIDHCLFDRNTAANSGGALYLTLANSQVTNCTFFGNQAEAGGAMYIRSGYQYLNSSIIAHSRGGGVVTDNMSCGCQIYHSLFFNNDGGDAFEHGIHAAFGIVYFTNVNGDSSDYLNNMFVNPQFVNSDESNFYLMPESVCIDAGDPDFASDPDGTVCDIGTFYRDLAHVKENIHTSSEIRGFELLNIWPNPFNSNLNISFTSQSAGEVNIQVYDILGKSVYTQKLDYTTGLLNTYWHAYNVPSGTYLLKVSQGQNTAIQKIHLVK